MGPHLRVYRFLKASKKGCRTGGVDDRAVDMNESRSSLGGGGWSTAIEDMVDGVGNRTRKLREIAFGFAHPSQHLLNNLGECLISFTRPRNELN